jgi:hypothetical protein
MKFLSSRYSPSAAKAGRLLDPATDGLKPVPFTMLEFLDRF